MTFYQLNYVMEVSRCGSINKAAAKLFVSQSNLSNSIHELEKELDIKIFLRSSKGIELTPDGSEFSMVFQFEHINLDQIPGYAKWDLAPLDFIALKEVFEKWQIQLNGCGWNSLFWDNHDCPRIVSR